MQGTRNIKKKLVAFLIVFILVFSNCATLFSGLISFAADGSDDRITYSAQFVMINNTDEPKPEEKTETQEVTIQESSTTTEETEEVSPRLSKINDMVGNSEQQENDESVTVVASDLSEEGEKEQTKSPVNQIENEQQSTEEDEDLLPSGLALEITLGVKTNGYLKNAKVDIKDLANQIFKLRDNTSFGDYIQSIDEGKIKLKQISSGTEVRVYIPLELKDEESIDIKKLQSGVELSLLGTYVSEEGDEEIITRSVKPVLPISNDMDLIVESDIEKFIPYIKDGRNEAIVQLKVAMGTTEKSQLPVKDTTLEIQIPEVEGANIKDVTVSAISTGFTNGLMNGDAIFTLENWSYQDGKVTINVNNPEKDGRYQRSTGDDIYVVSYAYENINQDALFELTSSINARARVFTSTSENEMQTSIENKYDLSEAGTNIVTYTVTRKTPEFSKGYLYANANAKETEYIVEYENAIDINISRAELVNTIQINEGTEYFVDEAGNRYATHTEEKENTYYEKIRLNKSNLDSIIGEEGNFEILLEDGTSLIQITKQTPDDGDGYITISFGENKIGKILMRINNPVGEGILNVVTTKAIADVSFEKIDFSIFKTIQEEFTAVAELEEGIISEMGTQTVQTSLKETSTNASLNLSRSELSTLVDNEDVEINISLNNSNDKSDMYKNPIFELVFPEEVKEVEIKDMNLLYGNDEFEIGNVETLRDSEDKVIIRVTLNGVQSRYTNGDSEKGTTILLKTKIKTDMYSASKSRNLKMNYYNEDATHYEGTSEWKMLKDPSSQMLIGDQGTTSAKLNISAPEGLVNVQMISNYNADKKIMSVDQGTKQDTIQTFTDSKEAEMRMIVINNTDEDMHDVHILGRTIFAGNKSITKGEDLGTNQTAPLVSNILAENNNIKQTIYYSEKEDATDDLTDTANNWVEQPENYENVKSYLIIVDDEVKEGDMLAYSYNFQIPEQLSNNIDLSGTYATYYTGTKTKGTVEPDKVVLTTGDAPVLKVETIADTDEASVVEGQIITYTVRVKNEGRSISENTIVNSLIPAGTTYIENGELRPDVTELKIEIGDIRPGMTEEVQYQVQVNSVSTSVQTIEAPSNIFAEGLEKPIYTEAPKPTVEKAEVAIRVNQQNQGKVVYQNSPLWYNISVYTLEKRVYDDCTIKMRLPDGLILNDAYVIGASADGKQEVSAGQASYDEETRMITWHVDRIDSSTTLKLKTTTMEISENSKEIVAQASITSPNLSREYSSPEVKHILAKPVIEYNYRSNINNQFIKEGDYIDYILDIKNVGLAGASNINISNMVPQNYSVVGANLIKGERANSVLPTQNVNFNVDLNPNESAQITLKCVVNNLDDVRQDVLTQNSWIIGATGMGTIYTTPVQNIVQQNYDLTNTTTANYQNNYTIYREEPIRTESVVENTLVAPLTVNETEKQEVEKVKVFRVMGVAFNDINNNGKFDENENGMPNIDAKLCDAKSQEIVAQTTTNSIGEYLFDGIAPGEYYVKFDYDNTKYTISEYKKQGVEMAKNSDVVISNYKAVTDKIVITDTSISDINIGLVRSGIFDLSIDVNVNQMTVQTEEETTNYQMENSKLGKVDINPKFADSSKVFVEYTVDVSNKGEIAGYAKRIVDYIPEGLEFETELNPNWYLSSDGYVYTDQLESELIQPGETKQITLILTKHMTENSTGLISNTFEIAKAYNEYAIEDIDSTTGNKAEAEDDMSRVDIIIGIQTGGNIINVMLITLLITLYVIKIHVDRKNKEVIA